MARALGGSKAWVARLLPAVVCLTACCFNPTDEFGDAGLTDAGLSNGGDAGHDAGVDAGHPPKIDAGAPCLGPASGRVPTFGSPIELTGNSGLNQSLTVGDVDGDGLPDVVQANSGDLGVTPGFLEVYFGLPDGGLSTPRTFGAGAFAAVVFDPDVGAAVAAIPASSTRSEIDLFASDGSPLGVYATQNQPGGIAVADMNGDGKPDLLTCEASPELFLNLGGGILGAPPQKLGPWQGLGCWTIAAGDLNQDGKPDVVVGTAWITVMLSQPDGTFFSTDYPWGAKESRSIVLQDLNGDGLVDIVQVGDPGFLVVLNKGYGMFLGSPSVFSAGADPRHVPPNHLVVADFNGDCWPDVVVTSGFGCNPGNGVITLFLGRGDGTFSEGTTINSGLPTPFGVAAYQGAGAALPSLVVADICDGQLELLPNLGPP